MELNSMHEKLAGWCVEHIVDGSGGWIRVTDPAGLNAVIGEPNAQHLDDKAVIYRLLHMLAAAPAVVVDEVAVAWRVRVYHKHVGRPHLDHWSRWQNIDKNSYDRTKAEGAYHEYDTFELQELGVIADALKVVE